MISAVKLISVCYNDFDTNDVSICGDAFIIFLKMCEVLTVKIQISNNNKKKKIQENKRSISYIAALREDIFYNCS